MLQSHVISEVAQHVALSLDHAVALVESRCEMTNHSSRVKLKSLSKLSEKKNCDIIGVVHKTLSEEFSVHLQSSIKMKHEIKQL